MYLQKVEIEKNCLMPYKDPEPIGSPAKRVQIGEEEQRRERAFLEKKSERYGACDDSGV